MALTSRINIVIGIDCVGHAEYYERLFKMMNFRQTQLIFSGLHQMYRKKEYGRMYCGLKEVKKGHRLVARTKMADGIKKMKVDKRNGRCYSSGIAVDDEVADCEEGQQPTKKKSKHNNGLTNGRQQQEECKCGA